MRGTILGLLAMTFATACRDQGVTPRAVPAEPARGASAPEDEPEERPANVDDAEGDDLLPPPGTVAPSAEPARVRLLEEIRREIGAAKTSRYSHVTQIDEASGTFLVDCSGFVDYALSRAAPSALAALPSSPPKHPRPRAEDFVKALVAGTPPWKVVARVGELQPGDVVAWVRPADSTSRNTGHVMVVDAPPRALGEHEWAVPVADSTASRHGASDSRAATKATGVGRGTIVLVVDAAGVPTAFRWSLHSKRAHATTIVLGRIVP